MADEVVPAGVGPDLAGKLERLRAVAHDVGAGTVVLREQTSISWLLGARSHVPQTLDTACLDVVVRFPATGEASLGVVTNAIEAPRLRETELADLDADWVVVPWWQGRETALPTGAAVASDRPYGDVVGAGAQVAELRRRLTPHQQALLVGVCRDAAAATTAAARRITPRTTEYAAAGLLAGELLSRALDPVVLMVAGHSRMATHRHPLPTTGPLGRRAMLVCCARRHGLVASVTRIIVFGELADAERAAYDRLLAVEAAFLDATVAGARIGEVVSAGTAAYAANGFDADEWHRHHQGGFSGWQPREYPARPLSSDVVPVGSVVAWNPSAAGWKVEDTCLVGEDGARPLVHDDSWPTTEVAGRRRPDLLVRA